MAQKVFKIPDGNGGFTFQIQTPDGQWHITDENGVPLPEEIIQEPSATSAPEVPDRPRPKRSRKKAISPADELPYVQFSMKIPKEEYRILSSYVWWRNLAKGEYSRSELLLHAGMEVIRKDREYREFLKKNPEIPG